VTVALLTVPGVEIVSTGTYRLASGETTFSSEDLADAIRAAGDPTVPAPRLKLGHTDDRFEALDGEPAFGTVQNMRLSDNGQSIIGDLVDVPEWLAASMQSSYPSRSIEGAFGFKAASGRSYKLAIANLSLLGVTWPGVTSLADLREILERNGPAEPAPVETEGAFAVAGGHAEAFAVASIGAPPQPVTAGLDLGVITRQFVTDLDAGEIPNLSDARGNGWPRSLRAEDDGSLSVIVDNDGQLVRVPITVQGETLTYGQPETVVEQYVPVAASGPRILAAWQDRAASRPSTTTEETTMDVDLAVLRTRLGLADDADEAAITEALATAPEPTIETETVVERAEIPEGMRLVDEETFEEIRRGAQQGAALAASFAERERNDAITAAIGQGRFPASRREHYASLWERDPEGTRTLLTASADQGGLETGLVPVGGAEIGSSGDGDNVDAASADAEHEAFMARFNPQASAKLRGEKAGLRVRTEV